MATGDDRPSNPYEKAMADLFDQEMRSHEKRSPETPTPEKRRPAKRPPETLAPQERPPEKPTPEVLILTCRCGRTFRIDEDRLGSNFLCYWCGNSEIIAEENTRTEDDPFSTSYNE